jgi:hypothetical protein
MGRGERFPKLFSRSGANRIRPAAAHDWSLAPNMIPEPVIVNLKIVAESRVLTAERAQTGRISSR